jgi:hypothetical protein
MCDIQGAVADAKLQEIVILMPRHVLLQKLLLGVHPVDVALAVVEHEAKVILLVDLPPSPPNARHENAALRARKAHWEVQSHWVYLEHGAGLVHEIPTRGVRLSVELQCLAVKELHQHQGRALAGFAAFAAFQKIRDRGAGVNRPGGLLVPLHLSAAPQ